MFLLLAASCGRSDSNKSSSATTAAPAASSDGVLGAVNIDKACKSAALKATEVGVSATEITISVMADTGSPLAPGIFQGDVDAITGYAKYINAHGGVGCRKVVVRTWDSKFNPPEVKNGQLDACVNSLAMVGDNSVFNPDPTAMEGCKDQAGAATGIPNVAAFAVDTNEMCSPVTIGVNTRAEACPIAKETDRDFVRIAGPSKKVLELHPGLHGVYLGNGDLPSTKVSAIPDIAAQEKVGITWDAKLVNSATEPQAAYVPRVNYLKSGSNFVYGATSDTALVAFRKEAIAQGVDSSKVVWECIVSCYTKRFLTTGASAVEGTYVWVPFVPLEEVASNPALKAFVTSVGEDKVDTWGVMSWQAAIAFQQVVNKIVADQGPNAITRAAVLKGLKAMKDFDAAGISGPRSLGGTSPCYVLLQVKGNKFTRAWPKKPGTLDCDPGNLATVNTNPEKLSATDLRQS